LLAYHWELTGLRVHGLGWGGCQDQLPIHQSVNHYSFLKTLETGWNLPPLTSNDRNATPMMEFFAPHAQAHHGQGEHERLDDHGKPNVEDHQRHDSRGVCNCQHFSD